MSKTYKARNYETLKADLIMGKKNEKKLLNYLNGLSENKNNQYQVFRNQYSTFDFVNTDTIAELKSRRCRCMKYHDTMVGLNKMQVCDKSHKDNVPEAEYKFYFLFTDGLYVWNYGDSKYQVRPFFHKDKQKYIDYAYIPVSALTLVCPNMNSF